MTVPGIVHPGAVAKRDVNYDFYDAHPAGVTLRDIHDAVVADGYQPVKLSDIPKYMRRQGHLVFFYHNKAAPELRAGFHFVRMEGNSAWSEVYPGIDGRFLKRPWDQDPRGYQVFSDIPTEEPDSFYWISAEALCRVFGGAISMGYH